MKCWFKRGADYQIGNGRGVLFWLDTLCGSCPQKIVYSKIYQSCIQQGATIQQVYDDGEWKLSFRRSFGVEEME